MKRTSLITAFITTAAAGFLLAGCAQAPRTPGIDLAKACQTRECVCTADRVRLFQKPPTADLLWRADGDAYCPPDHTLALVPPPIQTGGIRFN